MAPEERLPLKFELTNVPCIRCCGKKAARVGTWCTKDSFVYWLACRVCDKKYSFECKERRRP